MPEPKRVSASVIPSTIMGMRAVEPGRTIARIPGAKVLTKSRKDWRLNAMLHLYFL